MLRSHLTKGRGHLISVPTAQGPEDCSFRADNVTIRVNGNKTYASALCKGIRAGLRS